MSHVLDQFTDFEKVFEQEATGFCRESGQDNRPDIDGPLGPLCCKTGPSSPSNRVWADILNVLELN